MIIQLFKNGKGLIHGSDNKRVSCNVAGTLSIGSAQIGIELDKEAILPVLHNGVTGEYNATFTSVLGNVYELERVALKSGRIVPPSPLSIELMELRCRVEALETECETLREQCRELADIFDTNSLNFLIK